VKKYLIIILLVIFSIGLYHILEAEEQEQKFIEYKVRSGDNLYKIAQKYIHLSRSIFLNSFINEIKAYNNILDSNIIHIDQVLMIPVSQTEELRFHPLELDSLCGIYLNTYSLYDKRLEHIIARFNSLGCNALVVDFRNVTGQLFYTSGNEIAQANSLILPIINNPQKLINLLHSHGIELIARVTMFKDTTLARVYPHWRPTVLPDSTDSLSYQKNYVGHWLNPNNKEVQQYNLSLIKEIIALGVDEIQLDYVRFPTEEHLLDADYGIPDSLSKQDVITDFVKQVYAITQQAGVKLSADIFGIIALQNKVDVQNTGQDIARLESYLDRIHPMIYPSHFYGEFWGKSYPGKEPYYFIYRICKEIMDEVDDNTKIIPYLESFSLYSNSVDAYIVTAQIQAVKDAGLKNGFLFWNAGGYYLTTWEALDRWQP